MEQTELKLVRVLLVEDSKDDAVLVERALRRSGYEPQMERVENGEQLRSALQQPWEVVLADYHLPGYSVKEALNELHKSGQEIPFIIVSGSVGEDRAVAAMRLGAHDYIMKDNLTRLGPALDRELLEAENRRQRRRAEAEVTDLNRDLQRTVNELQTLLDVIPIGIAIAEDSKAHAIRVNRAFAQMLHIPFEQRLSLTSTETLGGRYRRFRVDGREASVDDLPLQKAARTGKPVVNAEVELVGHDGSGMHLLGSAAPLFDEAGLVRGCVGAFVDITERKAAEAMLRNTEKLATVGRLAATIAHEINNPLEAVTNVLYLMKRRPRLEPEVKHYIEIAQAELDRIGGIVKQTLGFHREAARPVPVKLREIVEETLSLYGRRMSDLGVQVSRHFESEGEIEAFPGEMRQVFSNLLINAIEAVGNDGRIAVRIYESHDWGNRLRPGVRVIVADSGPGIPSELRQRIFDPFFTTKGDKGSGLGLWVSDGIVRKHGGSIRLRSRLAGPYRGTVFSVFLPASPIGAERSAVA